MATAEEVGDFLREAQAAIGLGHCVFIDRQKNWQGLLDLGLTQRQAWNIIEKLTCQDYSAGPEPDDTDPTKNVWKFGYDHEGREVYIKLRLARDPRRKTVKHLVVWSFHASEYPLRYPLQGLKG